MQKKESKFTEITSRGLAYLVLLEFEQSKKRLDELESARLKNVSLSPHDRRFLKYLISGVVRHLLYLDWLIVELYQGRFAKLLNKTKTILRLALFELIYLEHIPHHATLNEYVKLARKKTDQNQARVVNGILRNYLRSIERLIPDEKIKDRIKLFSIKYSFPEWLIKRWCSLWGEEETEKLSKILNQNPQFDIRMNEQRFSGAEFEQLLFDHKITFQKSEYFDGTYKIKDIQSLLNKDWFRDGYCNIQDESAQIPVNLLAVDDHDIVLDLCAAPGGKFLQILKQPKSGLIAVAMDIDKMRLKKVKENMIRGSQVQGYLVVADGRHLPFKPVFSKILLDAPCSGLGVIAKHPDIKWRRSLSDLKEFSLLQSQLLESASGLLKPGGRLVYSTCTVDPMENESVIQAFLKDRADEFYIEEPSQQYRKLVVNRTIQTFPHVHQMDGSFCSVLKKNK